MLNNFNEKWTIDWCEVQGDTILENKVAAF